MSSSPKDSKSSSSHESDGKPEVSSSSKVEELRLSNGHQQTPGSTSETEHTEYYASAPPNHSEHQYFASPLAPGSLMSPLPPLDLPDEPETIQLESRDKFNELPTTPRHRQRRYRSGASSSTKKRLKRQQAASYATSPPADHHHEPSVTTTTAAKAASPPPKQVPTVYSVAYGPTNKCPQRQMSLPVPQCVVTPSSPLASPCSPRQSETSIFNPDDERWLQQQVGKPTHRRSFSGISSLQHPTTTNRGFSMSPNPLLALKPSFRKRRKNSFSSVSSEKLIPAWIESTFSKYDCIQFVPVEQALVDWSDQPQTLCHCGRTLSQHGVWSRAAADGLIPPENPTSTATTAPAHLDTALTDTPWTIKDHTRESPTDAYGVIEFHGGPHPHKAQYVRLGFNAQPSDILYLFDNVWKVPPTKLVITVQGGLSNFELNSKLSTAFRKGLLKAAKTTGALVITNGINTGVVRHVAAALGDSFARGRNKITTLGIASWGILKKREELVRPKDGIVPYHPQAFSPKGRLAVLNDKHNYFLLVDNGMVGRLGSEIVLRKRLEEYIVNERTIGKGSKRRVPMVCVVLEGGTCTIRSVMDYVTNDPPIPVVVIDGSGRAADVLAYVHKVSADDGLASLDDERQEECIGKIKRAFGGKMSNTKANNILKEAQVCVRHKHLVTVFRLGEDLKQDIDHAILTALLKGQNMTAPDQLALALHWDRVDIARSDIFVLGQEWPPDSLNNAMMEALVHDRVEFVKLLLENGVNMNKFLTINRLEDLYNTKQGPENILSYVMDEVRNHKSDRFVLPDIGVAIEMLMGNGYRCTYTSREFKSLCEHAATSMSMSATANSMFGQLGRTLTSPRSLLSDSMYSLTKWRARVAPAAKLRDGSLKRTLSTTRQKHLSGASRPTAFGKFKRHFEPSLLSNSTMRSGDGRWSKWGRYTAISEHGDQVKRRLLPQSFANLGRSKTRTEDTHTEQEVTEPFKYPFNELLVWAVLTKRQAMARLMWQHGEEAMAKALVASKLNKSLAKEAADDYLDELEITDELRGSAEEFRKLAVDLLEQCYRTDDDKALQLLTYELKSWGRQTCLSLAVLANHKEFLAHPCCQILLADLWHGGMRIRRNSNLKVIFGLIFPPSIPFLEFKTKAQLLMQPQTAAEHHVDTSDTSESSASSSDTDAESELIGNDSAVRDYKQKASQYNNLKRILTKKRRRRSPSSSSNYGGSTGNDLTFPPTPQPQNPVTKQRQASLIRNVLHRKNSESKPECGLPRAPHASGSNLLGHDLVQTEDRQPRRRTHNNQFSNGQLVHSATSSTSEPLRIRRRFYEFYTAPITTFWSHALLYAVFLHVLTYMCLVRTPLYPNYDEMFCVAFVLNLGLECLRKLLMAEPKSFADKLSVFSRNYWNLLTSIAVLLFLGAFGLRLSFKPKYTQYSRVMYTCTSVLWWLKLLQYLAVHNKLGPYITMVGKMVVQMIYIVTLLTVVMIAFGLVRQSITYPFEEWDWILVRDIFYKPYFMLYGEVYAFEIAPCGDRGEQCEVGQWIVPALMAVFLLVANILLINLLIAVFNNIYHDMSTMSNQMWKFTRYEQVMEFEQTPWLPPPFTVLSHVFLLFKFCRGVQRSRITSTRLGGDSENPVLKHYMFDYGLKLFLESHQLEELHDFEEECMDDMTRKKEYDKITSTEERVKLVQDKVEYLQIGQLDLIQKFNELINLQRQLDELNRQTSQALRQFSADEMYGGVPTSGDMSSMPQHMRTQFSISPYPYQRPPAQVQPLTPNPYDNPFMGPPVFPRSALSMAPTPPTRSTVDSDSSRQTVTSSLLDTTTMTSRLQGQGGVQRDWSTERPMVGTSSAAALVRRQSSNRKQQQQQLRAAQQAVAASSASDDQPPTLSVHPPHTRRTSSVLPPVERQYQRKTSLPGFTALSERSLSISSTHSASKAEADELVAETVPSSTGTVRRAKKSYVLQQNEMLREYEETSRRITGGLIGNRIRRETQLDLDTEEDEPVQPDEHDVQAYLTCLTEQMAEPFSSSVDTTSLTSARLEDERAADLEQASLGQPPPVFQTEVVTQTLPSSSQSQSMPMIRRASSSSMRRRGSLTGSANGNVPSASATAAMPTTSADPTTPSTSTPKPAHKSSVSDPLSSESEQQPKQESGIPKQHHHHSHHHNNQQQQQQQQANKYRTAADDFIYVSTVSGAPLHTIPASPDSHHGQGEAEPQLSPSTSTEEA